MAPTGMTIVTVRDGLDRFARDFGGGVLAFGVNSGIFWVTVAAFNLTPAPENYGINGYAMVPEGHPWSEGFPNDLNRWFDESAVSRALDVHGGVTYARLPWVGFSTCHPGDYWSPTFDPFGMSRRYMSKQKGRVWSSALVEREAVKLARQLARIAFDNEAEAVQRPAITGLSRFQHLDVAECNTPREGEIQ